MISGLLILIIMDCLMAQQIEYIQMTAELKQDIVQYCKQINEKCQLQYDDFGFESLKQRRWYLSILQILFPHLEQKIQQIRSIGGEGKAINKIIHEINDLDQFEKLDIDGNKIAFGDANQISNLVQVILALIEIATEEYEEQQITSQHHVEHHFGNNKIDVKINGNTKVGEQMDNGHRKQKKSLSDYDKPKSVQAIDHQFEKSDEEDESSPFENVKIQEKETQMPRKNYMDSKQRKQDLKEPYKKFPNQKVDSDDLSSHNYLEEKIGVKKRKVQKQKEMDPQKQFLLMGAKSKKKLITHPKSPETLKKARSSDAIALTKKVQQDIKRTKKKSRNVKSPVRATSPMHEEAKRKAKQYEYFSNDHMKQRIQNHIIKTQKKSHTEKNQKNLTKILNFRDEQIKKQRQEYEKSIKLKLINQKQLYIKKINKLIIELEREKERQNEKDFKETLVKDNEQALRKLTALQNWYKNKLSMLKQNRKNKNRERLVVKAGHKEIIGQIERQLKRENEERLIKLTDQFRSEQNNIQTDFQELRNKIIKVYHKN